MHSCGLRSDKEIMCWGGFTSAQLGDGSSHTVYPGNGKPTPALIAESGPWKSVTAGISTSCAIKEDNTAWCWGSNIRGKLGTGVDPYYQPRSTVPVPVTGGHTWKQIDTGGSHGTCGITTDGNLYCWGSVYKDGYGAPSSLTPAVLSDTNDWVEVNLNNYHACALREDNSVWCWGENQYGQLGDGTTTDDWTLKQVIFP